MQPPQIVRQRLTHPVYVVDDARDLRVATSQMLRACGLETRPFSSGDDFLSSLAELRPGVILLRLLPNDPDPSAFLANLRERQLAWPVIALADGIGLPETVAAMKLGASDVVEKPIQVQVLLGAVESARQELTASLAAADRAQRSRARLEALSPRELEVLRALLAGYTNLRAAELCNISVRTVEMHRANLIKALGVETFVGAARVAWEAGVEPLNREAA